MPLSLTKSLIRRVLPVALAAGLGVAVTVQSALPAGRAVPASLRTTQTAPLTLPDSGNRFALLIGVMGYPALRPRDRLVGPGNDVNLVADFLRSAPGMDNADIAILLDDGTHPPATLAAIRAEMARIAGAASPGDFVYIHFSGHGTQAPAPPGSDEPDGLDELFLPYDVGSWDGSTGAVQNALVDDEIGEMLDAIRAKGADVFAVFDACNSGTATRGPDEAVSRWVAPEVLGVPIDRSALPAATMEAPFDAVAPQVSRVDAPIGSLTAFFAAQASQSTPEMNLPRGAPERQPYGVFTYTLLGELAARPGQTYADLGTAILTRYATDGLAPGTQPLFEGVLDLAALRAPVTVIDAPVTTWPVTLSNSIASLAAGSLHGLTAGDTLDVRDASNGTALGRIRIDEVMPLRSTGTLIGGPNRLPDDAVAIADRTGISVQIDLAMPGVDTLPPLATLALMDALAVADPALAGRLNFLPPGTVADLRLVVEDRRIAIIPGGGVGTTDLNLGTDHLASVPLGPDMTAVAGEIAPLLLLEARALLLTRAAGALPPNMTDVSAELFASSGDDRPAMPLDPTDIPVLHPGDVISLNVSNARLRPVDIDILYIAADRSIQHIRQIRARPGITLSEPLFRVLPEGYGQEMILIVQRDVADGMPRDPLTFLATGSVPSALRTLGDDTALSLSRYLAQAGLGSSLRSPNLADPGAAAIAIIPVQTRP